MSIRQRRKELLPRAGRAIPRKLQQTRGILKSLMVPNTITFAVATMRAARG
jgi:hypothetical protein